jgi:hypothetical protein
MADWQSQRVDDAMNKSVMTAYRRVGDHDSEARGGSDQSIFDGGGAGFVVHKAGSKMEHR